MTINYEHDNAMIALHYVEEDLDNGLGQHEPGIRILSCNYKGKEVSLDQEFREWPGSSDIRQVADDLLTDFAYTTGVV